MTILNLSENGFSVKGHCTTDSNDELGRLVCASVSSAVYLTANTITDVVGDRAEIREKDGEMTVRLLNVSKESKNLLKGLGLHMSQLSEQYPHCIKVISEV